MKKRNYIDVLVGTIIAYIGCVILAYGNFTDTKIFYFLFAIPFIIVIWIIGNKLSLKKDIKNIDKLGEYFRDIPSNLSPAVISYLYDGKSENKKDIVANILDMCYKKAIIIEFDNEKIKNIILTNNTELLTEDELYLYNNLLSKKEKFSYEQWFQIIEKIVLEKNLFITKKINIVSRMIIGFTIFILVAFFLFSIGAFTDIKLFFILGIICAIISGVFLLLVFAVNFVTSDNKGYMEINKYTKDGAIEIKKWLMLKKYLIAFSCIKDRSLNAIHIWEKYLAYSIAFNINLKYKNIKINELQKNIDVTLISNINDFIEGV